MDSQFLQITPLSGVTKPGNEDHVSVILTAGVVYDQNIPAGSRWVMIQAIGQNIRFTLTGTDPTTTRGFRAADGDAPYWLGIANVSTLKFCAEVTGASLQLMFAS